MTSFDIAAITPELNQRVTGAYIDNIYQTSPRTLLLTLRHPGRPRLHLLIEAGKRLHLTSYVLEKPTRPSSFCMALRKYLRNGVVTAISQHRFERIVILKVTTKEGDFQLISELFGDGNNILVSPENVILQALTYRKMRDRNILRHEIFQHAPPRGNNPLTLSRQDFEEIKKLGRLEIVRALTKFLSIGGLYAEEILVRAKIDKNVSCASLAKPEMERLFEQLRYVLSMISAGKPKPHIVINEEGNWVDVTPFPLKKHANFKKKPYTTFNEALDEYYTRTTVKGEGTKVAEQVSRELAEQERITQSQQEALVDLKTRIVRNRKIGDMIYMHLNGLQYLIHRIKDEKKLGKPWEEILSEVEKEKKAGIVPATYFHSMEPKRRIVNVSVEDSTFPLNLRRSIQANATTYYNRAKKAEKKLKGAEKALQETQTRIKELQQRQAEELKEPSRPPPKRRKKAWFEKFRWFYSSDDFLVIAGRDATTNEIIIKKHMEPSDVVFHADIQGAPFVLIKTEGKAPPGLTIREAAQLAASYSRAWKEMLTAVDVYWISPLQVNKSPPSGQYLTKGSFMIHGSKNYVRNVPLRVAIGVKTNEDRLAVVGGPPQAISKQTNIYVEMIPGEQKSGKLAKQIQHQLARKASKVLKKQIGEISLEEIQRFIPLGRGKLL